MASSPARVHVKTTVTLAKTRILVERVPGVPRVVRGGRPRPRVSARRWRPSEAMALLASCCALAAARAAAAGAAQRRGRPSSLADLRAAGGTSGDGEVVGHWALAEMLRARRHAGSRGARAATRRGLDSRCRTRGMWASLARAVVDEAHGDPQPAADAYSTSLVGARGEPRPTRAAGRLVRGAAPARRCAARWPTSTRSTRAPLDALLASPRAPRLARGRGARGLAGRRGLRQAEQTGDAYDADVTRRMGCAHGVRLAGPFGHGAPSDRAARVRRRAARRPGPPRGRRTRVRGTSRASCRSSRRGASPWPTSRCRTASSTPSRSSRARGDRELIVAVQGAVAGLGRRRARPRARRRRLGLVAALRRARRRRARAATASSRELHGAGGERAPPQPRRHRRRRRDRRRRQRPVRRRCRRAIARRPEPDRRVRDARPSTGDAMAARLARAARARGVRRARRADWTTSRRRSIEPLVLARGRGGRCALQLAAPFAEGDPALPDDARGAAVATPSASARSTRDPALWRAQLVAILDDAEQHGARPRPSSRCASSRPTCPVEPEILEQLAQLYGRLGWRADQMRALADLATRFPDDVVALQAYLDALDEEGPAAEADKVAARIKKLDPDAEVDLDRALARHDYKAAIAELERLEKRRPDRKDIAARIADVLGALGRPARRRRASSRRRSRSTRATRRPASALADRAFAGGDASALHAGARRRPCRRARTPAELRAAIDLVEGATDLEPYRQGRPRDHPRVPGLGEGGPPHGRHGRARPRLRRDLGPRRRLERDARARDPEDPVAGGHQHRVRAGAAAGPGAAPARHQARRARARARAGRRASPRSRCRTSRSATSWSSSTSPASPATAPRAGATAARTGSSARPTRATGAASSSWSRRPTGSSRSRRAAPCRPRRRGRSGRSSSGGGAWTSARPRRWSPTALPSPSSCRACASAGASRSTATLAHLVDLAPDDTPLDPRLRARALDIVQGVPAKATDERARRLYRWALEHVQDGKETDGRRVMTGGSGSRQAAFRYMLRLLGIDTQLALVKNRLAMPPLGPMSEVEEYDVARHARAPPTRGSRWMTRARQVRAVRATSPPSCASSPPSCSSPALPREVVHAPGAIDGVTYEGRADVQTDGSAEPRPDAHLRGQPRHRVAQRARPDPAGQALRLRRARARRRRRSTAGTCAS